MNLTRRLLLLALISVLPAIVIWTYTEVTLRRDREVEVRELALRQARLAASEIERIFEGVRSLLVAVGEVPAVQTFDIPACRAYLSSLQPKIPHLGGISIVDLDGRIRCRHDAGNTDVRLSDRSYFKQAIATDEFVIGQYTEGRLTGQKVLPLALPLLANDGRKTGVIVASLNLGWLGQELSKRSLPSDGSITVADINGVILAREPQPERFVGTLIPEAFRPLIKAEQPGAMEIVSQDGTKRILGYIPAALPPKNIYVSAGLSSKAAFSAINDAAKRGFMLIAAAFALALSLAWLSGRAFVTKPFARMTSAVRAWRQGNYSARISLPRASGELGILAGAFNDLMDDVERRQTELRDSEERARLALEAGQMGTWWLNPIGRVGGCSPHAAHLLGVAGDPTAVTVGGFQRSIHPDDRAAVAKAIKTALRDGDDYESEFRVRLPDGSERWIDSRGRVFFSSDRQPVRMVGIVQDITLRKQADTQQRLLLDELNHRVKNTLATVQSIASQTLRSTLDPREFRKSFESRLLALSKTHDLLTRNAWREADLTAIIEQELAPYRRENDSPVILHGPPVSLAARPAINLGLVLHELATNAAKYGALSTPQGRLDLRWSVSDGPESSLHLSWREFDGPLVHEPQRQGFGSKLLKRSIEGELDGQVTLRFLPTGVSCDIVVPLSGANVREGHFGIEAPLALAG